MECVTFTVKDVDLGRCEIRVGWGEGEKERVTMMPETLVRPVTERLGRVVTISMKVWCSEG